ncbi:WbqC-like protein [Flavobacteriaceae bacterium MAR_2010_105]|nr:WbqC-like protein [Flavobacteriaceae bacterium MAR_2010_105]
MKLGIMQPYFLPYIGYFQLIAAVDVFVVYDNIQFTKKGWIHRNRFLKEGDSSLFTIPLQKDSDFLTIEQRVISVDYQKFKTKFLRSVKANYQKAPFFETTYPVLERILNYETPHLFEFIHHSILQVCKVLEIATPIVISSTLDMDHGLTGQDRVIAICKHLKATHYINPIGGLELYQNQAFLNKEIKLQFIKSQDIVYKQFNESFVPWLSILDVMMFNSPKDINTMLTTYDLN